MTRGDDLRQASNHAGDEMPKTVILCFIHGFKGGESTFGDDYQFTKDLRALVAERLPRAQVRVLVYPKYETRGDLGGCVSGFRSWLEDKVIDVEVEAGTTSPTVEPSVRTVLVGHSMGGIVAAETVIGLASEKPIYSEDGVDKGDGAARPAFSSLMFPYVQGVLALDTPFLGISPGVVAHGAEDHYQSAAAAVSQLSGLSSALWGGTSTSGGGSKKQMPAALPSTTTSSSSSSSSAWARWGKMAMYAGAAGAMAAGGAAAWARRDQLTTGWTWVSSHLEFVGCLARPEQLRKRVECLARLRDELDVGFANLYTRLGRAAPASYVSVAGTVLGRERTFCNLPRQTTPAWAPAVNDKAQDETAAHMNMFDPDENPAYDKLVRDAASLVEQWFQNDWYLADPKDEPRRMEGTDEPQRMEETDGLQRIEGADEPQNAVQATDEPQTAIEETDKPREIDDPQNVAEEIHEPRGAQDHMPSGA